MVVVDLSGQVACIKEKLMAEMPGHIAKIVKLQGNASRIGGGEGYISTDGIPAIPPATSLGQLLYLRNDPRCWPQV